jgi:phosphoribosylglycinamide formyltransferase 1
MIMTASSTNRVLPRVVVLISGRGSNLSALLAANLPVQFAAVISNKAEAAGLLAAEQAGIPTEVIDHRRYESREAFDLFLATRIDHYLQQTSSQNGLVRNESILQDPAHSHAYTDGRGSGLVILAGFMRIFSAALTTHFAGRMINIHPSLLPAFTGLNTHQRALDAGVKIHGCTVHLVTAELDHGPILAQAAVPVLAHDDAHSLADRVLRQEHLLYPQVIRAWAEGSLYVDKQGAPHWDYQQDHNISLRVPTLHPIE